MEGKISSTSGKQRSVNFTIRHLPAEERKKNALKGLGLFWGLSLASIPLPPIHWLTVPGFFFFAIYWFWRKLREHDYFEKLEFCCPECETAGQLPPQVLKNPLSFVCPHCRYGLKLSFDSALGAS